MAERRDISIQSTYRPGYPPAFDLYQAGISDSGDMVAGLSWSGRITQLQAFLGGRAPTSISLVIEDEAGQDYPLLTGVRLAPSNSPLNLLPLLGASDGLLLSRNAILKASIDQPQNLANDAYVSLIGFSEESGHPAVAGPGLGLGESAIAFQAVMTQAMGVEGDGNWNTLAPNSVEFDSHNFWSGPGDTQATINESGWYIVTLHVELGWAAWAGDEFVALSIVKNISETVANGRKEPFILQAHATSFSIAQPIPLESGCVIDARVAGIRDQAFDVTFAKFTAVKVSNL